MIELTNREREIATMISRGFSNKEIAAMCFVTEKSVKFHITNIYHKFGVVRDFYGSKMTCRAEFIEKFKAAYPTAEQLEFPMERSDTSEPSQSD